MRASDLVCLRLIAHKQQDYRTTMLSMMCLKCLRKVSHVFQTCQRDLARARLKTNGPVLSMAPNTLFCFFKSVSIVSTVSIGGILRVFH